MHKKVTWWELSLSLKRLKHPEYGRFNLDSDISWLIPLAHLKDIRHTILCITFVMVLFVSLIIVFTLCACSGRKFYCVCACVCLFNIIFSFRTSPVQSSSYLEYCVLHCQIQCTYRLTCFYWLKYRLLTLIVVQMSLVAWWKRSLMRLERSVCTKTMILYVQRYLPLITTSKSEALMCDWY